jgi:twitching motility protein PilT
MDIHRLLCATVKFRGSDLHLQADNRPMVRQNGKLTTLDAPPLSPDDVRDLVFQITDQTQRDVIERDRSADFSYEVANLARFRVNVFYQRDRMTLVARVIPWQITPLEELQLPKAVAEIAESERGLVLVTGTTGSGKSTTLAGMIDHLTRTRRCRIVTVEDPIEFVHRSQKSLIAQREVGADTPSFAESLRRALRQDPDVILVGELRDMETMRTVLQAADTGHLVFSTTHTTNAAATLQRLISMFPSTERDLLLTQLSLNIEAVISQRLARRADGGRRPVVEIMRNTPVIAKAILEGRVGTLPQAIANRDMGMQLFDQHLADLYNAQEISGTEALRLATNTEAVGLAMRGISTRDTSSGLVG